MADLSPQSFKELADRIQNDEQTALLYLNNAHNNAPPSHLSACDADCRKHVYCQQTNNVYFEMK